MKHVRILAALAAVLFISVSVSASPESGAPLSEREVAKFADDWPAVAGWFAAKGKSIEKASASRLVSAYLVGPEYSAFVRSRGWSEERFAYVAGTVFSLLAYVEFEKRNPDIVKQFDQTIAQVRDDPTLSLAEKIDTIKELEDAKRSILALPTDARVNDAELSLVRANYDRLSKAIGAVR